MRKQLVLFAVFCLAVQPAISQVTMDTIRLGATTGQDAEAWYTEYCPWAADEKHGALEFSAISAWTWNASGGCGKGETVFYLQFNLDMSKYTNLVLKKSVLKIFHGEIPTMPTTTGNSAMWVQRVTSAWDENILTWNTGQPTWTTAGQVPVAAATQPDQDYSIDVTPIVRQWFCGSHPNYGFRLMLQEQAIYRRVTISTSEHGNTGLRPLLELTFGPASAEPCNATTVIISNVFTPNNDQSNDLFDITVPAWSQEYLVRVFNRWGEEVFRSHEPAYMWDGNYNGHPCAEGVYFFLLEYKAEDKKQVSGTVTLMR